MMFYPSALQKLQVGKKHVSYRPMSVATIACVLVLAGCGSASGVAKSDRGSLAVIASESNGMQSLVEGDLVLSPHQCLAISYDAGGVELLALPPNSRWEGESIVVIGYGKFNLGDRVSFAGGGMELSDPTMTLNVPSDCTGDASTIFRVGRP